MSTDGPGPPDVIVVGGGVVGLAIAWRLATAGIDVLVADDAPAAGASHAAAGMLAPVTEVHYGEESLLALNLEAARRWPVFAAEVEAAAGAAVGYRREGTLLVAFDDDDLRAVDDLYRYQCELGLEVERLRSRECRQLEGFLNPRIRGGVFAPSDHQVDTRALTAALRRAGERAAVRLREERVEQILLTADPFVVAPGGEPAGESGAAGGRVAVNGVRFAGGECLSAGTVVLAAGPWSAGVLGLPAGIAPPVRPVKGQILRLRTPGGAEPVLVRSVRAIRHGRGVYLVPRVDGRIVVGATSEERGFDTTVTAGAVRELLEDATEVVPALAEAELLETIARLRPGSPDNAPIVGPSGVEGLVVATGHYRNGVLLSPVTADAVAELVITGRIPALVAPFTPRRFG
jgi:glycine oxidase